MTPDFTDTITLGDDVFSDEYWANHRVAPLLDAMRGVMADPPDYGKYIAYWHTRCKGDDAEAKRIGECYRALAAKIKTDGYTSNAWQHDGRDFDVTQGHGPMSVDIGNDGKLWPIDGSHRACILWLLGEPVTMWVWRRRPKWEKLKAFHKTLYTPYPHPDFAGHPVTRPGVDRFHAIQRKMFVPGDVIVLGACTGFGAAYFQQRHPVLAVEPTEERRILLTHWFHRLGSTDSPYLNISSAYAHQLDYGGVVATIALSVLQHAATSMNRLREIVAKMTDSPRLFVELPGDDEKQWHCQFRDETHGCPKSAVIDELIWVGNYAAPKVIYTDTTYANRQTILLQRP